MPIEIRELHIKVQVNEHEASGQRLESPGARRQERDTSEEAIIAECIEQILQIIQEKEER